MTFLETVLDFHPNELLLARKEVQKLHASTKLCPSELEPPKISALKARIEEAACHNDATQALVTLARTLLHRELFTAVRHIGQWVELRDAVDTIARERPLASYVAALWNIWQKYPKEDTIEKLLIEMGLRFGAEKAVGDRYYKESAEWLQSSSLIDSIVRWSDKLNYDTRHLAGIPDSPFIRDTPLIEYVFKRMLQIGSARQLLRLTNVNILTGWHGLSGISHMNACANFLRRIDPTYWNTRFQILEDIRENYGLPRRAGRLQAFWIHVSKERRRDFREYFIIKKLDRAFEMGSDRHKFWMKQRREILDICHGKAGTTEWSLIDFSGFSVVEFFEVGNAAYFYPDKEPILAAIKSKKDFSHPSELKKKIRFRRYYDNRIIHHHGWEISALETLERWKNRYS